jgi:hypothetical protein
MGNYRNLKRAMAVNMCDGFSVQTVAYGQVRVMRKLGIYVQPTVIIG